MNEPAVELLNVVKHYPGAKALDGLSLSVPENSVFALLGSNGAGKSTCLKILVNLLQSDRGQARVLGKDTVRLNAEDYQRIGYVSEDRRLSHWLTLERYLDFLRPLYPDWDRNFEKRLLKTLDLPLKRKLTAMSKGEKMKVRLLSNMAFRPRLLILDEPFSGLDPVVRDELSGGLLELTGESDWTVILASHDVEETERLSDRVGIVHRGSLMLEGEVESLVRQYHQVTARFAAPPAGTPAGVYQWQAEGAVAGFVDPEFSETACRDKLADAGRVVSLEARPMSLREIFVARARAEKEVRP